MKQKTRFYVVQSLYLAGLMVAFGLLGVLMGQDCNFDLMNYHFYNGFAFLFRPHAADIMPAGIHSFFIPWLDVPYYLVMRWGMDFPKAATFVQAAIYGVYAFILMQVCRLCFPVYNRADKYDWVFAWLVGVTGTMGISQIALASGEIYEAALLVLAVWLVLKGSTARNAQKWFLAGIIAAAAAFALKYTAAPFCVGIGAMVLYYWKALRQSYRQLAGYVAAGVLVIVLLDGWFWYTYWVKFGNPLFPFFNSLFHSPYLAPVNLIDTRFFPHHWWTWWLLPFYWVRVTVEMGAELPFVDYRWAGGFVAFWALAVNWGLEKYHKRNIDGHLGGILIFAGIGYVLWLRVFVILRYAVVLEGILGILMVWALRRWLRPAWKNGVLAVLAVLLAATTVYPDWGKDTFAEKVLVLENFEDVPDHSLILVQTQGLSYVLPFFNPTATFVGGLRVWPEDYPKDQQKNAKRRNQLVPNFYAYYFDAEVQQKIQTHDGPIYWLTYYWPEALYKPALKRWGITGEMKNCHIFNTSWNKYFEYMILCPVEKLKA